MRGFILKGHDQQQSGAIPGAANFKNGIMAFTIQRTDDVKHTWNIPGKKPHDNMAIKRLWAQGHELDYIRTRFDNIPIAHAYCVWHGEMAQFIFDNL